PLVRKQATVLLYGHGHAGVDLSVLSQLQFLEPTLLSPVGASGGHERDGRPSTYVRALQLIERGAVDAASLITHRYPSLDAVPGAVGGWPRAAAPPGPGGARGRRAGGRAAGRPAGGGAPGRRPRAPRRPGTRAGGAEGRRGGGGGWGGAPGRGTVGLGSRRSC